MSAQKTKSVRVEDIISLIEQLAPPHLSEEWDNCGLQVGSGQWEVGKIWVSLDPLISVIEEAGDNSVEMVITHHPLIFTPLKRIDLETIEGKVIETAIKNRTAIYAAHTNLDSAAGGINDELAQKIGLRKLRPLVIPETCDGSVAINELQGVGLGRIGELTEPMTVKQWVGDIKKKFGLEHVKVAGDLDGMVHRAAVCSGSGSSFTNTFLESDASVYVSGDLRYHDARAVEDAGRTFIDIGHFASEHIILEALVKKLTSAVQDKGWDVTIEACTIEKDPFAVL